MLTVCCVNGIGVLVARESRLLGASDTQHRTQIPAFGNRLSAAYLPYGEGRSVDPDCSRRGTTQLVDETPQAPLERVRARHGHDRDTGRHAVTRQQLFLHDRVRLHAGRRVGDDIGAEHEYDADVHAARHRVESLDTRQRRPQTVLAGQVRRYGDDEKAKVPAVVVIAAAAAAAASRRSRKRE